MAKVYDIAFKLGAKLNKNYGETFNKAQEFADKTVNKIKKTVVAIGALVLSASAITGAIDTYKGFEQSVANTAAIAGITQTSEAYALLEEAALDAGKATTKTAQEAADALGYMALAGWDVETSMQALMPVLRLSEASGMDLALASDMVTDTMSALGIAVDGVALGVDGLSGYLDLVAKAQNSSNMTAQQLMDAYLGVGGTLKSLNVSMDESAAVLGVMANRGTKGTEAATSLSRIITNLTAPTGKASTALEKLGYSAFDSEGNFMGLENALVLLQDKLAGANDEQMQYFTSAIGGQSALTELQQILDGLGDEYYELKDAISDNEGALDAMAETMNNTMEGAFKILASAVDDFKIRFVKQLAPYITPVIRKIADTIPLISEKFGLLGEFITNVIVPRFVFFQERASGAFQKVKEVASTAYNNLMAVIESNQPKLDNIISVALDIKDKLAGAFESAQPIIEWVFTDGLPAVVDALISVVDFAAQVYNFFNDNWPVIQPIIMGITGALIAYKAVMLAINIATKAGLIIQTLSKAWAVAQGTIALLSTSTSVAAAAQMVLNAAMTANPIGVIIVAIGVLITIIALLIKNWDKVTEFFKNIGTKIKAVFEPLPQWISDKFSDARERVQEAFSSVAEWFDSNVIQPVVGFFLSLGTSIVDAFNNARSFVYGVWESVSGWFDDTVIQPVVSFFTGLRDSVIQSFQNAWDSITSIWTGIGTWVDDNVVKPIVNFFGGLVDKVTNIGEEISQTLKDKFTAPITWIKDKWSGITGFFGGIGDKISIGSNATSQSIPGYATGTNYTPDTYIAGEEGPELIVNGAGRKVYDAVQTSSIFDKLSNFGNIKIPEISQLGDIAVKVKAFVVGPEDVEDKTNPFTIKNGGDKNTSITNNDAPVIQLSYAPQIKVETSGSNDDIEKILEKLLKKDKESFERKVIEIMEAYFARKVRLSNE